MNWDDLPRVIRSFGQSVIAYYLPTPKASSYLGRMDLPHSGPESQTIAAEWLELRRSVVLDDPAPASVQRVSDRLLSRAAGEIARTLMERERVVDGMPSVQLELELSVRLRVWPDVPGVTTAPWAFVGSAQPIGALCADLESIHRLQDERRSEGDWDVVWLHHPDDAPVLRWSALESYCARLVPDVRIPRGSLQLARSVA